MKPSGVFEWSHSTPKASSSTLVFSFVLLPIHSIHAIPSIIVLLLPRPHSACPTAQLHPINYTLEISVLIQVLIHILGRDPPCRPGRCKVILAVLTILIGIGMQVRTRIHSCKDFLYACDLRGVTVGAGGKRGELEDGDVFVSVNGFGVVEGYVEEEGVDAGLVFESCVEGDGGVRDGDAGGRGSVLEEDKVSVRLLA